MRQVLSWRFVAAIAAVLGLAFLVYVVEASRDDGETFADTNGDETRRMDVVALVGSIEQTDFRMTPQGTVSGTLVIEVMVGGQPVRTQLFPGTRGVISDECAAATEQFRCAVLGQSLGDTLVYFALVPLSGELRFRLPAIDDLQGGFAHLANGWEVPYGRQIDRTACDPDSASFGEFLNEHEGEFESIYDLAEKAIVAVDC
jgi:hypothetical protein